MISITALLRFSQKAVQRLTDEKDLQYSKIRATVLYGKREGDRTERASFHLW
jgi:hypothetical protein